MSLVVGLVCVIFCFKSESTRPVKSGWESFSNCSPKVKTGEHPPGPFCETGIASAPTPEDAWSPGRNGGLDPLAGRTQRLTPQAWLERSARLSWPCPGPPALGTSPLSRGPGLCGAKGVCRSEEPSPRLWSGTSVHGDV